MSTEKHSFKIGSVRVRRRRKTEANLILLQCIIGKGLFCSA